MADIESNINLNIDTTAALASIRSLQSQISAFHRSLAKGGAAANAQSAQMQQGLINTINKSGQFNASMTKVASTTDTFTNALEKNKLTMGETFKYSMGTTRTFGRFFRKEFDTISKVARERVKDLQTQYIRLGRDASGAMNAIKVRPLALDMENLATKTAIAAQKQQILNQLLKTGSTNLLNWGKNTQWAGRQLMVGFTIPLAMMGAAASKSFMEIEKQVIKIRRVYGDFTTTVEETDKAIEALKGLANEFTKYGLAVKDTLELASEFAAAGFEGKKLTAQVREASRLAVLGSVDQKEAFEATISVTNSFGVAAEDLAGKIDFLNAVENQSVLSIEDLTIAIPKAAPVVRQLGGDVEDLAFFLTAMKEGGINASEGANALKSGLASLINPTKVSSEFLANLGINIKGIVEANKGDVKGTVVGFAEALDTLDPLNRARAIEQLFGKFQFSRISTLFQNVIDQGSQANRVLKLTQASSEELAILSERELSRVENTTTFKFQKSLQNFQAQLAPVGEEFLKAVTPLIEFATQLLEKFNNMGDGAKQFATVATIALGAVGPVLLMIIGLIANGAANMIKFVNLIRGRFQKTAGEVGALGSQTEYMTQAQLKAQAAAASLGQVHSTLTQQFTSENAAIQSLIASYNQAVIAQNRFADAGASAAARAAISVTTNARGGRRAIAPQAPPAGYARGVISVPGPKGAGDVVPAMLSPGEAVIPAKQAKKYAPFIQDMISGNIPGFRVGLNPFKSLQSKIRPSGTNDSLLEGMLRLITGNRKGMYNSQQDFYREPAQNKFIRSNPKIAVKMQDEDLLKLIASKDKRYKSLFETNTSRAKDTPTKRSYVENQLFGLTDDIDPSRRPVYGHMFKQERNLQTNKKPFNLFEKMTGKEGTFFNRRFVNESFNKTVGSLMNPTTFGYGNTSMVLKNRNIRDRTTFTFGDSYAASNKQYPTPARLGTRGSQALKLARSTKDRSFFEAQIMGGFTLKDVKKIIVTQPELIPQLQQALRAQGIKIPVGMPKFSMLQRLKMLVSRGGVSPARLPSMQNDGSYGVPRGYNEGTLSVAPLSTSEKIPSGLLGRSDLGTDAKQRLGSYFLATDRRRRTIPQSVSMIGNNASKASANDLLARLAKLGVADRDAMKIMSMAADESAKGSSYLQKYTNTVIDEINRSERNSKGLIKSSKALTENIRSSSGWMANNAAAKEFAHIGSGGRVTAKEAIRLHESGQIKLSNNQIKDLKAMSSTKMVDVKSGLGMAGFSRSVNAKLAGSGATLGDFMKDYKSAGPDKWSSSIGFAGGNSQKMLEQSKIFDSTLEKSLSSLPKDILVVDTEAQVEKLASKGKAAVSVERLYAQARLQARSSAPDLVKLLDRSQTIPVELRAQGAKNLIASGKSRKAIGSPLGVLEAAAQKELGLKSSLAKLIGSGKPGSVSQLAKLFAKFRGFPMSSKIGGYANGVVSVPGPKGKGDVVPAMLSPGEAVIPTKMAKKYSPLINAMISGNVPGYVEGGVIAGTSRTRSRSRIAGVGAALAERISQQNAKKQEKNISRQEKLAKDQEKILKQQAKNATADAKNIKEQDGQNRGIGGKLMAGASFAGMGAMMYGMSGGPGADMAMMASMPLMMAPMLAPVLKMLISPVGLVVAGLLAVVATVAVLKSVFDDAAKAARDNALAIGASTDAMKSFAEFSGRVTAGEVMDERRSGALSQFGVQTGKESFGGLFVQSEGAKPLLEALKKELEGNSGKELVAITKNQLATAVATGALSRDEAASVAAQLGEEIGDRTFGIKVVGELNQLIGLDGKDLTKDPIGIRVRLLQETQGNLEGQIAASGGQVSAGQQAVNAGTVATLGLGGAIAGAQIGAAIGTAAGPLGTAVGAVAGGIVGIASGALIVADNFAKAGAAAGGITAQGIIALQQNQEMLDSLDLEYEKRIASAKAAGDVLKAEKLILEQREGREEIIGIKQQTLDSLAAQYQAADFAGINPMGEQLDKLIDSMYADNPVLQMATTGARRSIEGSAGTAQQEYKLKLLLASGDVDAGAITNLMNQFGQDQDMIQKIINIQTNLSGADAGRAFSLASLFGEDVASQKQFLMNIESKEDGEAEKLLDMFEVVQQSGGILEMEAVLDAYMKDPTAGMKLVTDLEKLREEQEKGPITQEIITTVFGAEAGAAVLSDWEYFSGLDKENQITYMTLLQTAFETLELDKGAYNIWKAAQPSGADTSEQAYVTSTSRTGTDTNMRVNTNPAPAAPSSPTGGSGRQSSAFLDDIVKKMRDLRDQTVKLPKSLTEAMNAITKFGKKSSAGFGGLANSLRNAGAGTELINIALGATSEELAKIFKNGKLTAFGKNLERALGRVSLGNFVENQRASTAASKDQVAAFKKLQAAGVSVANAQEMIKDADLVAGLTAAGATAADTQKAINSWMEAQKTGRKVLTAAERTIEKESLNIGSLNARIGEFQAGLNVLQLQEDDINKKYDDRLEALDKVQEANENIARQQQSQLTLADALSKGDIAAAARAMQETKEQSAQNALQQQRAAIEKAREKELNSIQVSVNGQLLNREEIQKRISDLQKQIANIELNKIAPAQRVIADNQREAFEEISDFTAPTPTSSSGSGGGGSGGGGSGGGSDKVGGGQRLNPKYTEWVNLETQVKQNKTNLDNAQATLTRFSKELASLESMGWLGRLLQAKEGRYQDLKKQVPQWADTVRWTGKGWTELSAKLKALGPKPKQYLATGGKVGYYPMGGMIPYKAMGGMFKTINTDSVPAMLSPGEFVIRRSAVERFGEKNLEKINNGMADSSSSVYNYSVNVSVKSDANPDQIAQSVMRQIKQIDSQRIRGNRF